MKQSFLLAWISLSLATASTAYCQDKVDLDATIRKVLDGKEVPAEELGDALEAYRKHIANGQPATETMNDLLSKLRDAAPVVVGPKQKFTLADDPLRAFRMVYVAQLARKLPPDQVEKHPSADLFPGVVPEKAPRVTETFKLNTQELGWVCTGLYAPPGEVVTVRVPKELSGKGLKVRVGPHLAELRLNFHKKFSRYHIVDREFDVALRKTDVASAFGGLIYLVMPEPKDKRYSQYHGDIYGLVDDYRRPEPRYADVIVENAVKAPRFVLGETNVPQWRKEIREYPAPWAEIGTSKVIFTLPSSAIRDMPNPEPILKKWDEVMDAMADLRGSPQERPVAMRFMIDAHVNWGAAYAGYPINAPEGWIKEIISGEAGWGHVHELGHLHQYKTWTFENTGEVTVNLFSLYALEKVYNDRSNHRDPEKFKTRVREWLSKPEAERDWISACGGLFERLNMYVVLIEEFGWDPLKKIMRDYRELPVEQHPKEDLDRAGDFALRYSREVNRNLFPLFEAWGVRVNPEYARQAESLPAYQSPLIDKIMGAS